MKNRTSTNIMILILIVFAAIAMPGSALFAPSANLSPADQRTMQLASAEEQLNNVSNAIGDLYEKYGAMSKDQYHIAAQADRDARAVLLLAKTASASGDLDTFDGDLKTVKDLLNQLVLMQSVAERHKT